jgi:cbb3-type cytochrome oxidase subunit 3
MTYLQKKLQKHIITATIITMACLTIYSLGFFTPLAPYQYIADYVDGVSMFFDENGLVQAFNRQLLLLAIYGLIVCIAFYLFNTAKRKIYYLSNYIISAIYFGLCLYIFYVMIVYIPIFKDVFVNIKMDQCYDSILCTKIKESFWFPTSTFIFDFGIGLSFIVLLSGIIVLWNAVAKFFINSKEKKLRKELKARLEGQ